MTKATVEFREPQTPMPAGEGKGAAEARLKREGRWAQFTKRRNHLKAMLDHTKKWLRKAATDEAWGRALAEFPPLPQEQLPPIEEVKPVSRWTAPCLEELNGPLRKLPLSRTVGDMNEAFVWVLNHEAMTRPPGPERMRYLKVSDFEGCPSRGAWTLLHASINDAKEFRRELREYLVRLSKGDKVAETTSDGPVDEGLDDLESVLKRIKGEAA